MVINSSLQLKIWGILKLSHSQSASLQMEGFLQFVETVILLCTSIQSSRMLVSVKVTSSFGHLQALHRLHKMHML
jgi:hypothetical protein